ncbi:hypothetical protein PTTG_11970 [Puccinia triticina 1-1 BBBD Race 1]|uniref:Uncharacterized protein n=1 Tax=Puccinia triticina (isolate 1-1 / race 1 (BBBD)) TaxID=630390 RepID=A0A180GKJ4_PUCT1|nr:hypothetical protein PTTG_11970 [Puccinia triticina 1-1 BBBD Race 1]
MAGERNSYRDLIAWGSTLEYETPEISRRAKQLYQRAKTNLSAERGHGITGINGNDRALACLCLCIIKLPNTNTVAERKAIETSLQRTSGVSTKIFSTGLRELPRILGTTTGGRSANASPTRKASPSKAKAVLQGSSRVRDEGGKALVGRKTEGKDRPAGRGTRETLMAAGTSLKRPASSLLADEEEDGVRSSPTAKRRKARLDQEEAPVPVVIVPVAPGSAVRTPRQGDPILPEPSSVRTLRKTPLALPIHAAP